MESLVALLNNQVQQHTQIRFNLNNIDIKELEIMLLKCYHAEVMKRRMNFIQDNITQERIIKAAKWLQGNNKTGLMLYGAACGTGKTTLANAMCTLVNYLFGSVYYNERKVVAKTDAIKLVKLYSEHPDLYNKLVNEELLFIDDLGTELTNVKIYGNEFSPVTELLYSRYDRLRWTIVTSNLSDEEIKSRYGERIDDRLREMFDKLHFEGESYRK